LVFDIAESRERENTAAAAIAVGEAMDSGRYVVIMELLE
jgi:hypothetical protein